MRDVPSEKSKWRPETPMTYGWEIGLDRALNKKKYSPILDPKFRRIGERLMIFLEDKFSRFTRFTSVEILTPRALVNQTWSQVTSSSYPWHDCVNFSENHFTIDPGTCPSSTKAFCNIYNFDPKIWKLIQYCRNGPDIITLQHCKAQDRNTIDNFSIFQTERKTK